MKMMSQPNIKVRADVTIKHSMTTGYSLAGVVTREESRLLSSPKCVPLVTHLGWALPNMPGLGMFWNALNVVSFTAVVSIGLETMIQSKL